eukprot:30655-Pelagococcus_subviridis.AAC.14
MLSIASFNSFTSARVPPLAFLGGGVPVPNLPVRHLAALREVLPVRVVDDERLAPVRFRSRARVPRRVNHELVYHRVLHPRLRDGDAVRPHLEHPPERRVRLRVVLHSHREIVPDGRDGAQRVDGQHARRVSRRRERRARRARGVKLLEYLPVGVVVRGDVKERIPNSRFIRREQRHWPQEQMIRLREKDELLLDCGRVRV